MFYDHVMPRLTYHAFYMTAHWKSIILAFIHSLTHSLARLGMRGVYCGIKGDGITYGMLVKGDELPRNGPRCVRGTLLLFFFLNTSVYRLSVLTVSNFPKGHNVFGFMHPFVELKCIVNYRAAAAGQSCL